MPVHREQVLTVKCMPCVQMSQRLLHRRHADTYGALQGGGTSARAAAAAAASLAPEENATPALRIQANPFLKGPAPTFMPRESKANKPAKKAEGGASSKEAAGRKQMVRKRSVDSGRLQHDDPFSLESL